MEFRKLKPSDADKIGQLEDEIYTQENPELITGADDFREDLLEALEEEKDQKIASNFSWGAFDDAGSLIGYLVGFRDESEVNDNEEVAYVSDIAVLPDHRARVTYGLMRRFAEEVHTLDLPIEGEFRHTSYALVQNNPRVTERLGFRVAVDQTLEEYNGGEDHQFIRLEPTAKRTRKRINKVLEGQEGLKDDYWEEYERMQGNEKLDNDISDEGKDCVRERLPYSSSRGRRLRREINEVKEKKAIRYEGKQQARGSQAPEVQRRQKKSNRTPYSRKAVEQEEAENLAEYNSGNYPPIIFEDDSHSYSVDEFYKDLSLSKNLNPWSYSYNNNKRILVNLQIAMGSIERSQKLMYLCAIGIFDDDYVHENYLPPWIFEGDSHSRMAIDEAWESLNLKKAFSIEFSGTLDLRRSLGYEYNFDDVIDLSRIAGGGWKTRVLSKFCRECSEKGIEYDAYNLAYIARYVEGGASLVPALTARYQIEELVDHPWLVGTSKQQPNLPKFPVTGGQKKQARWCAAHALYAPEGWTADKMGLVILRRLNKGVDKNLHDASFWLCEFQVPEESGGKILKDLDAEVELLQGMMNVPDKERARISKKRTKYRKLFSSEGALVAYEGLLGVYEKGSIDFKEVVRVANAKLAEYKGNPRQARSLKNPIATVEEQLAVVLDKLSTRIVSGESKRKIPILFKELKDTGARAAAHTDQAQTWYIRHWSTPHERLTYAWHNRANALKEDVDDNPRAIEAWAKLNGLRVALDAMEKEGRLPAGFERKDVRVYDNWLIEILRCYDAETAIQFIAWLKQNGNPEPHIPAAKRAVDRDHYGEILKKDDPSGATIGHDTGCCMTLGGYSQSCIEAGYSTSHCGFFALRREKGDELLAQSFLWVNEAKAPNTLIVDNIEANRGRDIGKVIELYQAYFHNWIVEQKKKNPNFKIRRVHVGTGYSSVGLGALADAKAIDRSYSGYTDATIQKLLLEIPKDKFEAITPLQTEIHDSEEVGWADIREEVLAIEKHAFKGTGYAEGQLEYEFSNPENIAVVLRDDGKIVGYCTALRKSDDTLYISSTALLPNAQGKGYVKFLLEKLDEEALRRGYRNYERHARVDNGYADKIEKKYKVIEKGEDHKTALGTARYIAVEIPGARQEGALQEEIWEISGASR